MRTVSPGETTPAPKTDKKKGPMTDDEIQASIKSILQGCENYIDDTLTPEREKATKYYDGEAFGNEKTGRSQFVHTEVRDQVNGLLPALMKLIFGPEEQLEFAPETRDQVAMALEMTRKVQHVFTEENNGFLETYSLLMDGLVRGLGVFKFWWEAPEVTAVSRSVDETEAIEIAARKEVEVTKVEEGEDGSKQLDYTEPKGKGRVMLMAIPVEEIIYNAEARDGTRHFIAFGHRTEHTKSELLAMYPGKDAEIEEHGKPDSNLADNATRVQRRREDARDPDNMGEANDKVKHIDVLIRIDADGDNKAELRRVCAIGAGYHVLTNEPASGHDIGYAPFCPSPKAHTLTGDSWAKRVMDLQYTGSMLIRGMLDSLALAVFPRVEYVEGAVNVGDVMNTAIGAPIRTRAPGMVKEFTHTFVGREAMPVLEFFQGIAERRTGMSKASQDLDLDALQSTTKSGVDAAIGASQSHIEMVARILCEMTLKPLFRGIADMVAAHQTEASEIEIDSQWVPIDPTQWKPLRPRVRVALGAMQVEKKLAILGEIITKQETVLTTLGPDNPLVSLPQYRNALALAAKLSGFPNAERFFKAIPADWQPQQPPAPQPSPEQLAAQVEQEKNKTTAEKNQGDLQHKALELQLKKMELDLRQHEFEAKQALEQQKLELDFQIEQMKIEANVQIELKKLEVTSQTKLTESAINNEIEAARERARLDAEHAREEARLALEGAKTEHAATLEREKMEKEHALERERMEHEQQAEREKAEREDKAREANDKDKSAERDTRKAEAAKPVAVHVHMPKPGKKNVTKTDKGYTVEDVD